VRAQWSSLRPQPLFRCCGQYVLVGTFWSDMCQWGRWFTGVLFRQVGVCSRRLLFCNISRELLV
jgi:hypothetical protein